MMQGCFFDEGQGSVWVVFRGSFGVVLQMDLIALPNFHENK